MAARVRARHLLSSLFVAMGVVVALAMAVPVAGASRSDPGNRHNEFHQTNLISSRTDQGAQLVDANLKNPWGLALGPGRPLWVADNNAGVATVYRINVGGTTVANAGLTVTLPGGRASTGDGPSPTGQVFNPTDDFTVTSNAGSGPAAFIFSSESGQITAWNQKADPVSAGMSTAQVEFSSPTAVYKGLALAHADGEAFLYATNFHDGTVDVFDQHFHPAHLDGDFRDPNLPAGFAPFGIQAIDGRLYVTYALQKMPDMHDDMAGPGNGFIDVYTPEGVLVRRLVSHGALNSPWGLAIAPEGFGRFAGKLLVGNFGDGRISAYGRQSGEFEGQLRDEQGQPITIDDLWGLIVGTSTTGGRQTLLFSAGINDEQDGLVGSINRVR